MSPRRRAFGGRRPTLLPSALGALALLVAATVAAATVVTILSDPDVQEFMRQGLMYWWDPLNAAAAITGRFVTYQPTRLSVVQSGVEAGRKVVDPHGARIRLGVAADARAFEHRFLAALK